MIVSFSFVKVVTACYLKNKKETSQEPEHITKAVEKTKTKVTRKKGNAVLSQITPLIKNSDMDLGAYLVWDFKMEYDLF